MFDWRGKVNVPLPRFLCVKQIFPAVSINNIDEMIAAELSKPQNAISLKSHLKVALAVGSRGIGKLDVIVRALVRELKKRNLEVFIVPSMGSHGGATAEGQIRLLSGYNITENSVGAPVRSSMEVESLGEVEEGLEVYVDKIALTEADIIIPIARIKNHTAFRGDVESGLHKMLCVGLGKHVGAQSIHKQGHGRLKELIPRIGQYVLNRLNVPFGVAIVENAQGLPAKIEILPATEWSKREPELLRLSRQLMGQIYFDSIDVLVVHSIGKNISGSGMDPNITGRFRRQHIADGPLQCQKIVVLGLTNETHGNAIGIGVADITTKKVIESIDFHATYTNAITSTRLDGVKIPVVMPDDITAISLAIITTNKVGRGQERVVLIENTSNLDTIFVSEVMMQEVVSNPSLKIVGEPMHLEFSRAGELIIPNINDVGYRTRNSIEE